MIHNLRKQIKDDSNFKYALQIGSCLYWLIFLKKTYAFFTVYVLLSAMAMMFASRERFSMQRLSDMLGRREQKILKMLSAFFSALIVVGNYDVFSYIGGSLVSLHIILMLLSGYVLFKELFAGLYWLYTGFSYRENSNRTRRGKWCWFLLAFGAVALVDLLYWYLVAYPGNLTYDSIVQLKQIISGDYTNHHPYYHTLIIKLCYDLGMAVFHDINKAVAVYSVFQILVSALVFAYAVVTLYEKGRSKKVLLVVVGAYALLPYHWLQSCMMWKDILFAVMVLLFVTCLYRLFCVATSLADYLLLFVSTLGFALLRSNGLIALLITSVVLGAYLMLAKTMPQRKKAGIGISVGVALVLAIILKGPVLNYLEVKPVDSIESLSIPLQQVARVVHDCELTESERAVLSEVVDIEVLNEKFDTRISDNAKNTFRAGGLNEALAVDKGKYIKFWITLGLSHPMEYVKAWVDQTAGYWNGGYHYYKIAQNRISENDIGIVRTVRVPILDKAVNWLIDLVSYNSYYLTIIECHGVCAWICIIILVFSVMSKRTGAMGAVPLLAIWLTLLIATPVFNELRYAYAFYCAIPIVIDWGLSKNE